MRTGARILLQEKPVLAGWRWLTLGLMLVCSVTVRSAEPGSSIETKIKAGYLFNFAKFVKWPAAAFPASDSPIVIGVVGGDPMVKTMRDVLRGKSVEGRPIEIKEISNPDSSAPCHMLFVSASSGKSAGEISTALNNAAILVVGESPQFAEKGGMIGFVRENESLRLSLNLEAAQRAGLKVSSQLASVARLVQSKEAR